MEINIRSIEKDGVRYFSFMDMCRFFQVDDKESALEVLDDRELLILDYPGENGECFYVNAVGAYMLMLEGHSEAAMELRRSIVYEGLS